VNHSFVRARDGKFTTFDAPGAGTSSGEGTIVEWASCLNPKGAIGGFYFDGSFAASCGPRKDGCELWRSGRSPQLVRFPTVGFFHSLESPRFN
jgi:hypothetical protein